MSAELPEARQVFCRDGLPFRAAGVWSLGQMLHQGRGWMCYLSLPIVFLAMRLSFRLFDTCLDCFQWLSRINPLFVNVGSPSVLGRPHDVGVVVVLARRATMCPLNRLAPMCSQLWTVPHQAAC